MHFFKNKLFIPGMILNLILPGIWILSPNCKKKPELPPKEVIQEYEKNAHMFCNAVVECFKEDAAKRLKDHPERAVLISQKMDRELCYENQYRLIGKYSNSMIPKNDVPATNLDLYKVYENCAKAVSSKTTCEERLDEYKNHPDCRKIKQDVY